MKLSDTTLIRNNLILGIVYVSILLSCAGSPKTTLKEKLLQIESPIDTCPTITGTYKFIGTPLSGMPSDWRGMNMALALDLLLWPNKLPENRKTIKTVEVIQGEKIQAVFKGDSIEQTLIVPENPLDKIGCTKGKIVQVRMRDAYGEAVSGKSIIKNIYYKNTDGSLNIIVEVVDHLRSLPFFYKNKETYGARFSPILQ
ncbi:MAG: hypothetical protein MRJ96_13605 [Nitrospirales bacterium]|nr:hypothetical protein [Nitrospira sp.]MDR4502480.1 hypothetical protein [Nitrospirales bacterium]